MKYVAPDGANSFCLCVFYKYITPTGLENPKLMRGNKHDYLFNYGYN